MRRHVASSRERYHRHVSGAESQRDKKNADRSGKESSAQAAPLKQRDFPELLRRLHHVARRQRRLMAMGLVFITFASLLKLVPPAATGFIFDYVLGGKSLPAPLAGLALADRPTTLLTAVAVVVMVVSVVSVCLITVGRYLSQIAVKRLQLSLRDRIYRHAVFLPLHKIHQFRSGGMTSLLRNDAGLAGSLLSSLIFDPWASLVQIVGTVLVLAFIDWRMLAVAVVTVPLLFVGHRLWVDRIRPLWRDVHASRARTDSDATEFFSGIRVVRGFGREATEARRYVTNHNVETRQEMRAWWGTIAVEVLWALLIPVAVAGVLWYGGTRILLDTQQSTVGTLAASDALTAGDLVMFLFYLAMLLAPMALVARSGTEAQHGLAALDRILDLLDEPLEPLFSTGTRSLDPQMVLGEIGLQHVHFTYPESNKTIIEDANLEIKAGQTVALVGRSGAGKSTLCNVIARFFAPSQGKVTLDGINIRDIRADNYRQLISIVEQDVFLFDGTIAENISYGVPNATMAEIEEVAAAAHVTEFVAGLEKGFETRVGERGVHLSGGQRQRLTIARALLANPRVLILDEATSDLDSESEALIQQSLRILMANRTVLVIAHRLSTIADADLVVVLDQGRIVESGKPAKLWAKSAFFKTIMQSQVTEDSAEDFAEFVGTPSL